MKINAKKIIIIMLIAMFITVPSYAKNNTVSKSNADTANKISKNTTNTNNASNTTNMVNNTTQNTNNNTDKQNSKSNKANLTNLGIKPNDFSGFSENKTSYEVTVPNSVSEVEIYATKRDSKASITGTGIVKLQEGNNIENVVVTAVDGTTKTYTINIQRLKVGEKEKTTSIKSNLRLESLSIEGFDLEPSFQADTYQYKIAFEGSQEKLNIQTVANQNNARIKIIGNQNLVNGQNVVTIILTDENETEATTYQIYVNKNMVEQETIAKLDEESYTKYKIKKWVVRILIALIFIFVVILLILIIRKIKIKRRKKNKRGKRKNNRNR